MSLGPILRPSDVRGFLSRCQQWAMLLGVFFPAFAGCSMQQPDRQQRMERGYVFYLDGAGGSSALVNWGQGVRRGMMDIGYEGAGEIYPWGTQLGVFADQRASLEYKQSKAEDLAQRVQDYAADYPQAPLNIIALSAGSAVGLFSLEQLPAEAAVDNLILLNPSIAEDYNLTRALSRVREHVYVFTSPRDAVLELMVPVTGNADRSSKEPAGLHGFRVPADAGPETQLLYAEKLVQIPWKQEFEQAGNYGGHTDFVGREFVRTYVAPLFVRRSLPSLAASDESQSLVFSRQLFCGLPTSPEPRGPNREPRAPSPEQIIRCPGISGVDRGWFFRC